MCKVSESQRPWPDRCGDGVRLPKRVESGGESSRAQKTLFLFLICVHWLIFVLVVVTNLCTKITPENLLILHTAAKILYPCLSYSPNIVALLC